MSTATPSPDVTPPIIEVSNLQKRFGKFTALDGVNLSIPHAAVGLLGANGAGKTTLIRTLLGLSKPTRGSATVAGFDTQSQGTHVREVVGYMPEADALPSATTAADFVAHMAEMSGLPPRAARQRSADVLYQVGLGEERYRLISGFSTGMRQRTKLAQAIVHDPQLVLLDEPTAGMDPQGREEMLALVKRIYQNLGIAVVFSSHILEDIERLCDYIVILDEGQLLTAQSLDELEAITGEVTVRVDSLYSSVDAFKQALRGHGLEVQESDVDMSREEFTVISDQEAVYDLIRDTAVEQKAVVRSLRSRSRSLEDIYLGNVTTAREMNHVN